MGLDDELLELSRTQRDDDVGGTIRLAAALERSGKMREAFLLLLRLIVANVKQTPTYKCALADLAKRIPRTTFGRLQHLDPLSRWAAAQAIVEGGEVHVPVVFALQVGAPERARHVVRRALAESLARHPRLAGVPPAVGRPLSSRERRVARAVARATSEPTHGDYFSPVAFARHGEVKDQRRLVGVAFEHELVAALPWLLELGQLPTDVGQDARDAFRAFTGRDRGPVRLDELLAIVPRR